MIKRLLSIMLLAAGLQTSWSFALLGPFGSVALANGNPNGDSWQTVTIGYQLAYADLGTPGVFLGDIGGPKNIGEGYRRNTPQVYYAYDANFLGFFGTDGAAAGDAAFAIMNNLTNVSSYSSDLTEFPLQSQHFDFQAQTLFLTDVKSATLHLLVETMGLAEPERFTWTLAERFLPPGAKCPLGEIYLVLQRNFDISPSAPSQTQYSPYVNDVLYSYNIREICSGLNPLAITVPYSTDPLAQEYTSVAANNYDGFGGVAFSSGGGLQVGGYYTGLTRDDVGGLRYLYRSSNIVTEDAAAGSLLLTTNLPPPQVITTLSYGQFISQLTNDPAALQLLYPDLEITSATTNFAFTNITVLTPTFTNFPGSTVTNFGPAILITNIDLALFTQQALTNGPAALQALYPQIEILSAINNFSNVLSPNVVTYITNAGTGSEFGSTRLVTTTNGFSPNIFEIWSYTFGNILTNFYAPSNKVVVQTVSVTNLIGSPFGSSVDTNVQNFNVTLTNSPSGDIFIIPTNFCGFTVLNKIYQQKVGSFTNIIASAASTNGFGTAQFTESVDYFFTNRIWVVQPGICEPTLIFETNQLSTVLTNFQYTFGNLFTNPPTMQFTNSQVTIITTNIGFGGNGLVTNVTTQTETLTNIPSGDFFIIPAAWTCGFQILQVVSTNSVGTTNTIVTPIPLGVTNGGQQFSVTIISFFTNHLLEIQPFICQTSTSGPGLRGGIEKIQFIRANFDALISQFFQPITNNYTSVRANPTNGQALVETLQRVVSTPDILLSANDFIAANTFNGTVSRGINFDTADALPGLAGPGIITGPVTFDYNKIGNAFENGASLNTLSFTTNQFFSEMTQIPALAWASFDGSTNQPEVYPNGNSIQNLQNQILTQVSPTTLPNGTLNTPYPTQIFTLSGGSLNSQLTWTSSGLPPGITLSQGGVLSGTPTQSGTFEVTIQATDSNRRSVQWFYTLIIQ